APVFDMPCWLETLFVVVLSSSRNFPSWFCLFLWFFIISSRLSSCLRITSRSQMSSASFFLLLLISMLDLPACWVWRSCGAFAVAFTPTKQARVRVHSMPLQLRYLTLLSRGLFRHSRFTSTPSLYAPRQRSSLSPRVCTGSLKMKVRMVPSSSKALRCHLILLLVPDSSKPEWMLSSPALDLAS